MNPFHPYVPYGPMGAAQSQAILKYPRYRALVWLDGSWVPLGSVGGDSQGWNDARGLLKAIQNLAKMYKPNIVLAKWRTEYGPWMLLYKDTSPVPQVIAPISTSKGATRRASYWARGTW